MTNRTSSKVGGYLFVSTAITKFYEGLLKQHKYTLLYFWRKMSEIKVLTGLVPLRVVKKILFLAFPLGSDELLAIISLPGL